jgi:putative ABC transport system permease protein
VLGKLTLRSVLARKARILLTTLSVVVGVAFVSGAFVLTDSFEKSFDKLFSDLNAGVDLRVRGAVAFGEQGSGDPVPASLADALADVPGVAVVEPGLQGSGVILDKDGEPVAGAGGPQLIVAWTGENSIGGTELRDGAAPKSSSEVAIDKQTADRAGHKVGDTISVVGNSGKQEYTLVGTVGISGSDGFFGATVALFDPETAQKVVDSPGEYQAIDLAIDEGASLAQVESAVRQQLPANVEVVTGQKVAEETSEQITQIVKIFRWVLLGFATIALFVSAFLINNTFQIIISQRLRELALLRAVGASGRQVRRMIVLESLIIAAVATTVGFLGGIGVSKLLTVVFNSAGGGFPDAPVVLKLRTLIVSLVVGFGVTLAATIIPALRASRVPPIAAMRPELASQTGESSRRRIVGGVMAVAGLGSYVVGVLVRPGGALSSLFLAGLGVVVGFIGVTTVAASFAAPVARLLGRPISKAYGVPGRLAAQNAARSPRRTASTSAALMIGVALVSGVGVLGASLRQSFVDQLDQSIRADFFVTTSAAGGPPQPFPPAVAEALAALPELDGVSGFRFGNFEIDGQRVSVGAADAASFERIIDIGMSKGGYDTLADGGVLVLSDEADKRDLDVGDTIDVRWKGGSTQTLTVSGLYDDAAAVNVQWIVDSAVFSAANPSEKDDFFAGARIADGVEPDAARSAVESVIERFPQVQVQDRVEFKKSQEGQLNQALTLIYALLGFAVVIAILGIMNTLALAVFERTREFGLLRAVGTTQRQLKKAIRWEAVIVSVFGALLGLAVGLPLGIVGTQALKGIPVSGVTQISIPWGTVIAILILSIVAGLVAAMWPARRASKLNVLDAIATT